MISLNTPNTSQQFQTGILVNRHIKVQAAAEATGYNAQYTSADQRSGVGGAGAGISWDPDRADCFLLRY
jgi:hypothetical protein